MMGLVGKKIGMTRIFNTDGISTPVSVIKIDDHYVTQIKIDKMSRDFYIQVTTGIKKFNKITKPELGHFKKSGVTPGIGLWEFCIGKISNYNLGDLIKINFFETINKVDITGFSKGKGFSGTVKRWNFRTQDASHGNSLSHRAPGSIGQNQTPGRVFKGKKMAGHLGAHRVTIQNIKVIRIDVDDKILLVKGGIPGFINGKLIIKPAIKV
ncbi:50S ribosomal protein L3 [Buchnera aphidicola (Thelaxes californica)]|uniref:Large ribosomal subunit protein uL3 n=1 Tax=Buchnera aphidicola (Thelaxes californica) TaxID=1315998 RepID=A0A4D6YFT4_9GAMM|nr:50S ribosomal protein L3 [Buchnera aphidicola]QCI27003.1 50S ribosomal protein L3 [Buchnera aphidicola (Thelaxes californica)]